MMALCVMRHHLVTSNKKIVVFQCYFVLFNLTLNYDSDPKQLKSRTTVVKE
jgi:hypothetical protein